MVSSEMYSRLEEHERRNLKIYWYTGKDQKTPLNAKDKSRNCHVKLMSGSSHRSLARTVLRYSKLTFSRR